MAGVYDGQPLQLFVDGELQSQSRAFRPPDFRKRSQFCLGGRLNEYRRSDFPFSGVIDAVRISVGARYTDNFEPLVAFGSDADTLTLFTSETAFGKAAIDYSDHPINDRLHNTE